MQTVSIGEKVKQTKIKTVKVLLNALWIFWKMICMCDCSCAGRDECKNFVADIS